MTTARALLFHGAGQSLELCPFPTPVPRGEEILVRVTCCTLCTSDLHTHAGRRQEPTPLILGHEIVGRIEAFGPTAPRQDWSGQPLVAGERITWSIAASCGNCFFCAEDLPQKCTTLVKYGHERWTSAHSWSGGLADVVLMAPGTACLRLPDDLPDALAAPANCATATAAAVLRACSAGKLAGRSILIFGAGVLGLTACAMACSAGAHTILVCDLDPERGERARCFGATHTLLPQELPAVVAEATAGRGVDIALELAGAHTAVPAALSSLRVGGTLVLAGTVRPTPAVELYPEVVVRRLLTIRGVHNYAPVDLHAALTFLSGPARRYPFSDLLGPIFPLEQAEQAFAHAHTHPGIRVAVIP